jgi:prepilin signal peptidase PulO-like enzyme (type II secretory pathway)
VLLVTHASRTLAAFVLALDLSFVFVVFAICVLGLDSSELLQRHFGTRVPFFPPIAHAYVIAGIIGFVAVHQMGIGMQTITSPRS